MNAIRNSHMRAFGKTVTILANATTGSADGDGVSTDTIVLNDAGIVSNFTLEHRNYSVPAQDHNVILSYAPPQQTLRRNQVSCNLPNDTFSHHRKSPYGCGFRRCAHIQGAATRLVPVSRNVIKRAAACPLCPVVLI